MKKESKAHKRVYSHKFRLSVVKEALESSESIATLAKKHNVSRKTMYAWIKKYKEASNRNKRKSLESNYKEGKDHYRFTTNYMENPLLRLVIKHPEWGCRRYSTALKRIGIDVGYFGVYNFLVDNDIQTPDARLSFYRNYAGPGRYKADVRNEVVQKALEGTSITSLSNEYSIARKTIYAWMKKYNEYAARDVLEDSYLSGAEHHNALDEGLVQNVLDLVAENPSLSAHKLAEQLPLSTWSAWKILNSHNLNHYNQRLAYATEHEGKVESPATSASTMVKSVLERFTPNTAPAPPPSVVSTAKAFIASFATSLIGTYTLRYWVQILFDAPTGASAVGLVFATIALVMGSFFFLYSVKYYLTLAIVLSYSQDEDAVHTEQLSFKSLLKNVFSQSGNRAMNAPVAGLRANISSVKLDSHPYVSVQIPFFNEKYVAERAIIASTNFDYEGDYEVMVCDDSTDETTEIIQRYIKKHAINIRRVENKKEGWSLTSGEVRPGVTLKHLHRTSRSGFKGAALKLALTLVDERTEFISIFDADFVPYPDSLDLFLKYFKVQNGSENYKSSDVAAVQGYQWHVLNKSENWITRGVRSEYAGSYVIERAGQEIYGGLKHISGSVYMIRKDVLEDVGWKSSITEDYELTLRLYDKGYRVVYTPYIQAPAECVSTLKRLIRQRMRWAEGHSYNVKLMWKRLLIGNFHQSANGSTFVPSKLTLSEKIEFLFNVPYYLQAFFFLVGTFAWLLSEAVFQVKLPFWTTLWGWSLVFTNMFALPLVNAVGLFLEESEERDYMGLLSFIVLSYVVVPFQAYAAMKGFLEKEEGGWFRTPKTGIITDVFARDKFYRFVQGIFTNNNKSTKSTKSTASSYLKLSSGNNTFNSFNVLPRKNRIFGQVALTVVVGLSTLLSFFGNRVQQGALTDLPVGVGVEVQQDYRPVSEQIANVFTAKDVLAASSKDILSLHDSSIGIAGIYLLLTFIGLSLLLYLIRRKTGLIRRYTRPAFVTVLVLLWLLASWPGTLNFNNPLQVPSVLAADSFRVTEYHLTTADFTGTTYDLTLDQNLADDYFVLIRGAKIGNGASNPDNDYARVYEVPNATGELADSGALNVIALSRHVADVDWEGVVTVVECIADCSVSGFQLVDIVQTSITASSTSGTDTSTAWSDVNDVVLFGGFHGGGAEFESDAATTDGNAVQTRLYPSSTNTINWTRDTDTDTSESAVTLTTFVVEWGSEWTVQHVNVSGSTVGPSCDAAADYNTGSITSVARDNTWVWGTGISNEEGIGDSASGTVVTLGDGQNQNTNETLVGWCGEYTSTRNFDIYTMTHSDLAVDYRFKADGNSTDEDLAITVDSATDGQRFAWVTNGTNGSGSAHPRDRFWARYTGNSEVTLSHGYTGQNYPAWAMGIDFSAVQVSNATPTLTFNNVPFDNEHTGDSTPDFEFTGTDPDGSADIIYHIQIDDDYQFGSPLIECESDTSCATGAGSFTNTVSGGDTSPFNEGELIRFTPTTTMTDDVTYYWRLRAEDDTGSGGGGFYSNWSSVRSLTYNSSVGVSEWFQTTDEQFDTSTYSSTRSTGSDSVEISGGYTDPIFETGTETIDDSLEWTSVSFVNSYSTAPVILATPVTAANCEAEGSCAGNSTTQGTGGRYPIPIVRNVTTTGFDISMCVDGGAATCQTSVSSETFNWFAFDVDDVDNYSWIDAGTTTAVDVGGTSTSETYASTFSVTPAVWTQAQTYSQTNEIGAHAWVINKTTSGFDYVGCIIDPNSDNDCDSTATDETFGYVAIDLTNESFPASVGFQTGNASISNSVWTTANFSPSYTSPRVMVTQNSEGGSEDPQYAWARDVTTSDMEFRFCEQDGASLCNTHNAEDVYWFAVEQSTSSSSGTIQSAPIDYDNFVGGSGWNEVYWNEDETNGSVSMQVYYTDSTTCDTIVPDGTLSGNSSGFATSPIDISGLSTTTHNEICLRATLTDSGGTPYLEDWAVTVPENPYLLLGLSGLLFGYIKKRKSKMALEMVNET